MQRTSGLFLLPCLIVLNLFTAQAAPTANGIIRISNNTNGLLSNGRAYQPDISRNGQYVVYESEATDLISGDTNGEGDVFLYSVASGNINRVSEPFAVGEPNGWSREPSISETGNYIAFTSDADNLIAGDTNGFSDIFVFSQTTQQLRRVSIASDDSQADLFSNNPAISGNGRFVVFMSFATNLVNPPPPTFSQFQVYLHDRNPDLDAVWDEPGQILTIPVSINNNGDLANDFAGFRGRVAVSDDGMTIAFVSSATNLVANDMNGVDDVFIHRRDPDNNNIPDEPGLVETIRVSVSSLGNEGDLDSFDVQISADGDLIVFNSNATNLVPNDTNGRADVFVYNRPFGTTTRVSVSSSGAENPGGGQVPDISANGRYITFHANDSTLVNPTCATMLDCVYRHDHITGQTQLITYQPDGTPSWGHTYQPVVSSGGDKIAFLSDNGFLDGNTSNNEVNVYLWTGIIDPGSLPNQVYLPQVTTGTSPN